MSVCPVSYHISVALIKHHDQSNLRKKECICASGTRGIRVHHDREAWQPAAGMVAGTGNWETHKHMQRRNWKCIRLLISKPLTQRCACPARLHHLNLPRQQHVSFKPPQVCSYCWNTAGTQGGGRPRQHAVINDLPCVKNCGPHHKGNESPPA